MFRYTFLLLVIFLGACATKPMPTARDGTLPRALEAQPVVTEFKALPGWEEQKLAEALPALLQTCRAAAKTPTWNDICAEVLLLTPDDETEIRRFFETRFVPWKMTDAGKELGLVTGYYEPSLKGSTVRSDRTPWPVYGVPADLLTLDIPVVLRQRETLVAKRISANRLAVQPNATSPKGEEIEVKLANFPTESRAVLKGRLEGNKLQPYYTRAEIAARQEKFAAPILAWVEDPVELFFMQIQGAGRIELEDGRTMRLGYADNNGQAYRSIGGWLATQGEMSLSNMSMQNIQRWLKEHPDRLQTVLNANPRYIFFKVADQEEEGPVGALGVPLTEGYSIAVDPTYIPLGSPVYLVTTWPLSAQTLARLVHAQDTGSAIRGPVRADFFWGFGSEAGRLAGKMKQTGRLWLLLPRGVQPDRGLAKIP